MKGNSSDTHLVLYDSERTAIERWASSASRADPTMPWSTLVLVVDLRGRFGRSVGLHRCDRVTLDRRIRHAVASAETPTLSVPVSLTQGEVLVEAFEPELLRQVRERPAESIPILLVDSFDAPRIGIAFVRTAGMLN
jgi:hypothetical protein